MPFYKDSMSNGHLYIEFLVEFPPRASIIPEKQEKLRKIFGGMETEKGPEVKKNDRKILEEYDEADLNESAQGGK